MDLKMAENFRFSVRYYRLERGLSLTALELLSDIPRTLASYASGPPVILSQRLYLGIRDALGIPLKDLVKRPPECIPYLSREDRKAIFKRLDEIRASKGITKSKMEIEAGMARTRWSQILCNGDIPTDITLYKAAKALGIKLSELYEEIRNED